MGSSTVQESIKFVDLARQRNALGTELLTAIQRVLDKTQFILGPEVNELENTLASYLAVNSAVTCANGTDALLLALMAENISVGDVVLVPAFTFAATAEVVALAGATPVFVDVSPRTYNITADSIQAALEVCNKGGVSVKALIGVELFGCPLDYDEILPVIQSNKLTFIIDGAQSFGASYRGKPTACYGDYFTTSFFPGKPFSCYGDGGAVFCHNKDKAELIRSLRVHGKGSDKYDNVRIGLNSRLDTLQAAILLEKFKIYDREKIARQRLAEYYNSHLKQFVNTPVIDEKLQSSWAQYTICMEQRDELQAFLRTHNIPSVVYYPKALHEQSAYKQYIFPEHSLSGAESLARNVLSLPIHPYLSNDEQSYIISVVLEFVSRKKRVATQ